MDYFKICFCVLVYFIFMRTFVYNMLLCGDAFCNLFVCVGAFCFYEVICLRYAFVWQCLFCLMKLFLENMLLCGAFYNMLWCVG